MSEESKEGGDLVRFKIGPSSLEFAVSKNLASIVGRLLPVRLRSKGRIEDAFVEKLIEKIGRDESFTEGERGFIESCFSSQASKEVRLALTARRALEIEDEEYREPKLLFAGSPETGADTGEGEAVTDHVVEQTPNDFLNKFREDVGLVDEENIRDLYARILVEEARRPHSFSLSTLRVLRYLDREAAESFAKLQSFVMNSSSIPYQVDAKELLAKLDIGYVSILRLEEYGLLNSTRSEMSAVPQSDSVVIRCNAYKKILVLKLNPSAPARYPINVLTTAGQELSRIIPASPNNEVFIDLGNWLRSKVNALEVQYFDEPGPNLQPNTEIPLFTLPEEPKSN
jgi:hypothetical protein